MNSRDLVDFTAKNPLSRSPDRRLFFLGLAVGTSLFVGALGLRWPVLLAGLSPPLGAVVLWRWGERRQRRPAPVEPISTLFDASLLRERLQLDALLAEDLSKGWGLLCERLEAVRTLAVHCTELDPSCSVPLLVLLERLVDRAAAVRSELPRLRQAPTDGSQRLYRQRLQGLQEHLQTCLEVLGRNYDAALEDALRCPDVPPTVLLSPSLLES